MFFCEVGSGRRDKAPVGRLQPKQLTSSALGRCLFSTLVLLTLTCPRQDFEKLAIFGDIRGRRGAELKAVQCCG